MPRGEAHHELGANLLAAALQQITDDAVEALRLVEQIEEIAAGRTERIEALGDLGGDLDAHLLEGLDCLRQVPGADQ